MSYRDMEDFEPRADLVDVVEPPASTARTSSPQGGSRVAGVGVALLAVAVTAGAAWRVGLWPGGEEPAPVVSSVAAAPVQQAPQLPPGRTAAVPAPVPTTSATATAAGTVPVMPAPRSSVPSLTFSTVTAPAPGVTTPTPSSTPFTPVPAGDDPVRTAERFVAAWARPGAAKADWLRGVDAYASPEFAQLLASTDPSRIPANGVAGPGRITASTSATTTVQVPANGATVAVTCVRRDGSWVVTGIEPVSDVQGAPTPVLTPVPSGSSTRS